MVPRRLVPELVVQKNAAGQMRGRFQAAALFVDISGFTTLTETLMQHAKDGAEVLTDVLNGIFSPVVHEVYRRGGFISTFAGDAFTALFPQRRKDACDQAAATAAFIGKFFTDNRQVSTPYGDFNLAVKLGLAMGAVDWGILGSEDLHTFYFRGKAIDASAEAEHHASAGQIIASGDVLAHLKAGVVATPHEDHWLVSHYAGIPAPRQRKLPALTQADLAPFVLDAVVGLTQRAEFRDVCSVFISFESGSDEGTLDAFATAALAQAHRYGGYFNKVDFGDKGGVMLALFGAPVAHEDNVRRAMDFVLALKSEALSLPWRAGLTFGTVYAGIIGGEERCEYTAIGDVVNLSARLMMKAAWGEIWASEPAYEHLQSLHDFDTLGPHTFKGKSGTLAVFRWRRRREGATARMYEGALVGRSEEVATLTTFLAPIFGSEDGVNDGGFAGVAYVYGEPGMGKSRLVYEVRQTLTAATDLMWAYCPAEGVLRQSFNPLTHYLRTYFGQSSEKTVDENKAAFDAALGSLYARLPAEGEDTEELRTELERTRSMLGALFNLYWPGSLYEALEPKLRFGNTLLALVTLFKAESRVRPLVIELDEGHVLDEDSSSFFQLLARDAAGFALAVIISSRYADDGSKPLLPLGNDVPTVVIDLAELSTEGVKVFAEQVLDAEIADDVVEILAARTNGNPFFVEQLALYLRERGLLVVDAERPERLRLSAVQSADVPASVTAVLISRLDRLAADVKQVVQTASVLGREFELQVLAQMVSDWLADESRFRQKVAAAQTHDVWLPLEEINYIFKHALMRDSAYDMQLRARLRDLHRLAAVVIEQVHADELPSHYADLAHHFEQAADAERARFYLLKAGDYTKANFQNAAALALYGRLLNYVAPEDPLHVYAHEQRGEVYATTGEYDLALEEFQAGLVSLQQAAGAGEDGRLPGLYRRIGSVYTSKGDYAQALQWLERAATVASPDSDDMARIHIATAGVLYRQGKATEALGRCLAGLELAQSMGEQHDLAHAHSLRGTIHTGLGMLDEAIEDYNQSLALCQALGDLAQQSRTDNSLGAVYYYKGDWDQAVVHYQRSLKVAEQIGYVDQQATVANNLGEIFLIRGQFNEAAKQFESCLATWRRTGFRLGVGLSHYNLAQTRAYRQEWDEALNQLRLSAEVVKELGSQDWLAAEVHRLTAEVRLGLGQWDEAREACLLSLQIATAQDLKLVEGNARRVLGHWYGVQHQWDDARRELEKSLELAEMLGMRLEQGQALVELALLAMKRAREKNDPEVDIIQVEEPLRRAAALFRDLGAEWHLANVLALLRHP